MKKIFTFLTMICVLGVTNTFAQGGLNGQNGVPVKESNSVFYGSDVIIDNNAIQNQRGANLSIAFNGWAYSVYTIEQGLLAGYSIEKSIDDGATWNVVGANILLDYQNIAVDQVVCGTSTSSLYLFQAGIAYFPSGNYYVLYVDKYDATTGSFLGELYYESSPYIFYDVKIVSDYKLPSVGTSPYSIGLLFSRYSPSADSLIFISSANAGNTFTDRKTVYTTGLYLDKISLSHGASPTWFNGRYYAAWEEKSSGARIGKIWVSHTNPYFNSDWVVPTQLDNIAGSSANLCKNPVVSCQENTIDNDAANFTAIVLFDRDYGGNGVDFDVIGMYNKQGSTTGSWIRMDISNDFDNTFESDITFDPGFSNFLVTYCDSTSQQLPYVVQGMNLPNPSSWIMINAGYNDFPNLVNPFPKVEINPVYLQVGHLWISNRPGGNGMAMWDAEYSSLGIPPAGQNAKLLDLKVFPNPCSSNLTISFTLKETSHVTLDIVSAYGNKVSTILDESLLGGKYTVPFDVSTLPAGCYYYSLASGNAKATGKIIVIH